MKAYKQFRDHCVALVLAATIALSGCSSDTYAASTHSYAPIVSRVQESVVMVLCRTHSDKPCAGSGIVYDKRYSVVLTNHHVIADAASIVVETYEGKRYTARVITSDPLLDVALLKVDAIGLKPARFSYRQALNGDDVIAIGNPFGVGITATFGHVSRQSNSRVSLIQVDAPVNPGNSGGALFNYRGEVIGMTNQIFTPPQVGAFVGIAFAIPSGTVKWVADELWTYGRVRRGDLGLDMSMTPSDFLRTQNTAIIVRSVHKDGAAEAAGVLPGDILLKVHGRPLYDIRTYLAEMAVTPVDQSFQIEVYREGKTLTLHSTISDKR